MESHIVKFFVFIFCYMHCRSEPLDDKNDTIAAKVTKFSADLIAPKYRYRFAAPKNEDGSPVLVTMYINIQRAFSVDAVEHTFSSYALRCMHYSDSRFKWDRETAPVPYLLIRPYVLWSPYLKFENVAEISAQSSIPTLLESDGSVISCREYRIVLACTFDLTDFPYDSHRCRMKVRSSTYTTDKMIFEPSISMVFSALTSEWSLNADTSTENTTSAFGNISTVVVDYILTRRPHLYSVRVYLPLWMAVMLFIVSAITPLDHRLPLSCIVLLIATLHHCFLLSLVKGTTDTPRIMVFSTSLVVTSLLSVATSAFHLYHLSPKINPWLISCRSVLPTTERWIYLPLASCLVCWLILL